MRVHLIVIVMPRQLFPEDVTVEAVFFEAGARFDGALPPAVVVVEVDGGQSTSSVV